MQKRIINVLVVRDENATGIRHIAEEFRLSTGARDLSFSTIKPPQPRRCR
jgi:hypothetical protein